jgi:hypothetical protein
MIRSLVGFVAGLLTSALVIGGVEAANRHLYRVPSGMDLDIPQHAERWVASAPVGALVMVLVGWTLGTFAGVLLARLIAQRAPVATASAVAMLLGVAAVVNLLMIQHPSWFWVASAVVFVTSTICGVLVAKLVQAGSRTVAASSA